MARIRPFRALRYDARRAGDPARLLAPPYDVVDETGRAKLASRSENNCVHVILPEAPAGATSPTAKYGEAARRFQSMIDHALLHDPRPAFYVYHQTFESEGRRFTRKGFIGLVELTPFGHGPILAHERTLSGPKADRLELMRACDAHLELVFGLFSDRDHAWEAAVAGCLGEPVLDCDFDGAQHRLHRVDDVAACGRLADLLDAKSIYIADGHHRYETMCTLADELEARGRGEQARWGMIYLSNLEDEGLVVLPTHRVVHHLPRLDLSEVLAAVSACFEVEDGPLPADAARLRAHLRSAGEGRPAVGLSVPGSGRMTTLRLRADFDPAAHGLASLPAALQRLDVVLLHELVLERALGIDKAAQAAKTSLRYYKSTEDALELARGRKSEPGDQLVCFMNATSVHDVVAVCDSGAVMPQKSTFFHPKIPTGLVFHRLAPPTTEEST